MGKLKKILFLSGLDFKDKSIQVIRKTPEAYIADGWDVYYVVARDNSRYGNYFYEKEINLKKVNCKRIYYPFVAIRDNMPFHVLRTIVSKFSGYIVVLKLAYYGNKIIKENKMDVVYGYEVYGVLAVNILKFFKCLHTSKIVSRFQGTFAYSRIQSQKYSDVLLNWDSYLAMYLPSDLCIMTDDGTMGDKALKLIRSKNLKNLKFWNNGVDDQLLPDDEVSKIKKNLKIKKETVIVSVSRLVSWKRVDRIINIAAVLKHKYYYNDFILYIVGDGEEREKLESLALSLDVTDSIIFTGGLTHLKVKEYLNIADFFISTYDGSNVGNPLLEAISAKKIVFTLNNGDTSRWIRHFENGFIYNIDANLFDNMAKDILQLITDRPLRKKIISNVNILKNKKLWSWKRRFKEELCEVGKLLIGCD